MFRLSEVPKTYISFRSLLEHFNSKNPDYPNKAEILQLLQTTNDFLNQTSPDTQKQRDPHIKPKTITTILDGIATNLKGLYAIKGSDEQTKEVYDFCKGAVQERLSDMKTSNDKIHQFYASKENALKTLLNSDTNDNSYKP